MTDPHAIGVDVSRLVQSSPNGEILGSALAVLIKRLHQDFRPENFGCRNLREFIRKYAKEVFEKTRQGTDVVYSAALLPTMAGATAKLQEFRTLSTPLTPTRPMLIPTSVWKTFVSPNKIFRIFANRETGEFRVLRRHEEPPDAPWLEVQPCPAEIHIQIAKEFIESLPNELAKTQLSKILGLDSWWNHFFFCARTFGIENHWSGYRRRRLHDEFEGQMKSLGVPPQFSPAPSAGYPAAPFAPATTAISAAADASGPRPSEADDSQLRRIAVAVIRRLPNTDLREVWLPLGYVVDEFGEK